MKSKEKGSSFSQPIPTRLREARIARGLSIAQLAGEVGVTRQAISRYELGHASPSGSVFSKIVNCLDFPLSYFYDQTTEMSSCGPIYFRSLKSASRTERSMIEQRAKWMERIYLFLENYISFPDVNLPVFNDDNREVIFRNKEEIEIIAQEVRKHWGLGLGPISNVLLLLEKNGVIITRTETGSIKTDACSEWRGSRPFIFLGSDKQSAVRSRFDVAHELGHLLLHMWVDEESLQDKNVFNQVEKEANCFAGAFLLPADTFGKEVMSTSLVHFNSLKQRWLVSIQAMIYRCEELEILSEHQILYLRKQMSKYRMKEPLDDFIKPEKPQLLNKAIELLIESGIFSPREILDEIKLPPKEIENLCGLDMDTLKERNIGEVIELRPRMK